MLVAENIELTYLIWSTLLAGAYILVQSTAYRLQHGVVHAAGARDSDGPPSRFNGRAERALKNFLETYAVFVALSVAIVISDRADGLTAAGASLYFWARWVYLPLYLIGIQYMRSLVWIISAIGLMLMFIGVAF